MKNLFLGVFTSLMYFLFVIWVMPVGDLEAIYLAVGTTLLVFYVLKYQRREDSRHIASLKDQLSWQSRLLELTHEANPEALRAGLGLEAEELVKLFMTQHVHRRYGRGDPHAERSVRVVQDQIKAQKRYLSRLVETAVTAGLTLPAGWRYQDLASKRDT